MGLTGEHRAVVRDGNGTWVRLDALAARLEDSGAPPPQLWTMAGWQTPSASFRHDRCPIYESLVVVGGNEVVLCRATADHVVLRADAGRCQVRDLRPLDHVVLRADAGRCQVRDLRPLDDAVAPFDPAAAALDYERDFGNMPDSLLVTGVRAVLGEGEQTFSLTMPSGCFAVIRPGSVARGFRGGPAFWSGDTPPC